MLLQNFLEDSARRLPDKVALVHRGDRLTYDEINRKANQIARLLNSQGIRRGDRVAIFLDNSSESVISLFGILKADAVFLMLSPQLKGPKLAYILDNCGAKAFISDTGKIRSVSEVIPSAQALEAVILTGDRAKIDPKLHRNMIAWSETESQPDSQAGIRNANIDVDLASIIYTSGSTGNPKGVMLTHLNMVSAATSITTYLENVPEDIVINVLPLSFDYGLYQVLMTCKFGGTLVLEKSFVFPYEIVKRMSEERVTGFPGVPTIFAILLQMKDLRKYDLGSLRYITNTAAALPVTHIRQIREAFPQARLYSMYGLTECKRVSYLPPEELDRRPDSVGRGMPNEEVWIVDDRGNRLGPGAIGELVVRGSNVMKGYWGDQETTDRVLKPGPLPGEKVLCTGDLFRMDEEGFLYFVGRKDDMIKTRGERVSPKEVENALYAAEGVAEAAVLPVPDELLGSAIKAYIVPKDGADLTDKLLLLHCKKMLEEFAIPKYFEFRDSLPKNASGKIDKLALKAELVHKTQNS
ncbi:MAG TPA: AMP-binding protein [Syntrophales bacterium]|nr:AMP-binding protein [Syntrophales bacterium]HQM30676.1 AMP-binding protein [Syntrophales bacterium]